MNNLDATAQAQLRQLTYMIYYSSQAIEIDEQARECLRRYILIVTEIFACLSNRLLISYR